jgi:hypothetical protein
MQKLFVPVRTREEAEEKCPWAAEIIDAEEGFCCFESVGRRGESRHPGSAAQANRDRPAVRTATPKNRSTTSHAFYASAHMRANACLAPSQ